MSIVIDITSLPDIESYDGLNVAIEAWLDREDLAARIPYFIRLAEAQFRRVILSSERETTTTLTAAASVTLPSDFLEMRAIYVDSDPLNPLEPMSLATMRTLWNSSTGVPRNYAVSNRTMILGPSPDSAYDLVTTYNASLVSLSVGNQSNWLLADHPDIYLFGSLLQAEFYGWNDQRLPLIKDAVDTFIAELNAQGNRKRYGAAPLRMRPPVIEVI